MESFNFLVCVRCFTFNHSKYIEDAMNGFTMQQTDFPFVCVIVDDASTDGEPEIIRNYLQKNFNLSDDSVVDNEETDDFLMTFAQHKTNKNCFFAVYYLKYNHYSIKKAKFPYITEFNDAVEYNALCEGDDYWIDQLKLQKQFDFMKAHDDYSMCFHNSEVLNETDQERSLIPVQNRDYSGDELFDQWIVPTASIFQRHDVQIQIRNDKNIINGDVNIVLNACAHGKVRGFSDVMAVYRIQKDGLTLKRVKENYLGLQEDYVNHYKALKSMYPFLQDKLFRKKMADTYINMGKASLKGNKGKAIRCLFKGFTYSPYRFIERIINIVRK